MASRKSPVSKNQSLEWQEGATTRTADKPNVIVILVDNLGLMKSMLTAE